MGRHENHLLDSSQLLVDSSLTDTCALCFLPGKKLASLDPLHPAPIIKLIWNGLVKPVFRVLKPQKRRMTDYGEKVWIVQGPVLYVWSMACACSTRSKSIFSIVAR